MKQPAMTTLLIFTISLLILVISLLVSPPKTIKNETLNLNSTRNYIVRFVEYKKWEDHRDYLSDNLGLKLQWKWIERRNPAAKYPTDFGLLSIPDDDDSVMKKVLIEKLEKLELVKDVHVDMSYERRSLLGNFKTRERMGAFVDGRKRPGKIFTSMSFGEGDAFVAAATTANASINWSRNLLSQVLP